MVSHQPGKVQGCTEARKAGKHGLVNFYQVSEVLATKVLGGVNAEEKQREVFAGLNVASFGGARANCPVLYFQQRWVISIALKLREAGAEIKLRR